MKTGWAILVAGAALLRTVGVAADDRQISVGDLRRHCLVMVRSMDNRSIPGDDRIAAGFCGGYVTASREVMYLWQNSGTCLPQGVDTTQLARVFLNWADAHPETHHWPRFSGLLTSWRAAFPCQ